MKKEKEIRYIELINANKGLIMKVCSMYAQNRDDFKDLRQDILMQVWKALDSFRGDSKISTWMYRIALNCAILNHRRSGRTILASGDLFPVSDIAADKEPEFGPEDFNVLHAAIRLLPEVDRAIILLYLEEHPHEEISQVMGMTVNNISVRILRIKKRLKSILEQHGYNLA